MKIKLVVGFRRDQEYSVDAEEAHKAYYLFLHPDSRGVFNNGLAIKGSSIEEIKPDYNGTMGWNETHVLNDDDMNEIRGKGIDRKLKKLMSAGKEIAGKLEAGDLNTPLTELVQKKYPQLDRPTTEKREGKITGIG